MVLLGMQKIVLGEAAQGRALRVPDEENLYFIQEEK
jgi:hypothetical protein